MKLLVGIVADGCDKQQEHPMVRSDTPVSMAECVALTERWLTNSTDNAETEAALYRFFGEDASRAAATAAITERPNPDAPIPMRAAQLAGAHWAMYHHRLPGEDTPPCPYCAAAVAQAYDKD